MEHFFNLFFTRFCGCFLLAYFVFLLHVNELVFGVVELVLQEGHFLAGDDAYAETILHLPATLQGDDTLVDVGRYVGVKTMMSSL